MPKETFAFFKDLCRRLGDLFEPRVVAAVAAREVQVLHAFLEGLDAKAIGPLGPGLSVFVKGVALAAKARRYGLVGLHGAGEDAVSRCHPADRGDVVDLFYVAGAPLRALAAGGAAPDLFLLDLAYAERGLADELSHRELADLVPGTDGVALAALVTVLYRFSAFLLDLIYYLLKRGYNFHFHGWILLYSFYCWSFWDIRVRVSDILSTPNLSIIEVRPTSTSCISWLSSTSSSRSS